MSVVRAYGSRVWVWVRAACRGGAGASHEQQELALVLVHVFVGGLGYGGDRAHDGDVQSGRRGRGDTGRWCWCSPKKQREEDR